MVTVFGRCSLLNCGKNRTPLPQTDVFFFTRQYLSVSTVIFQKVCHAVQKKKIHFFCSMFINRIIVPKRRVTPLQRISGYAAFVIAVFFLISAFSVTSLSADGKQYRVLVLSETDEWDHQTRGSSDSVITELGILYGFSVQTTAQSEPWFTDSILATFDAVGCINTTGALFTAKESEAFRKYIDNGGGFFGMHACTDAEYDHPWFAAMTGANFNGHPFNIATARVAVIDKQHVSTQMIIPDTITRTDEWYFWADNPDFRGNPRVDPAENSGIHVLMTLDESSIAGSALSGNHPICWCRSYGKGRVWYCGFGHDPQTFRDTLVRQMLLGGIEYAAGMDSTAPAAVRPVVAVRKALPAENSPVGEFDLGGRHVGHTTADGRTLHGIHVSRRHSKFLH